MAQILLSTEERNNVSIHDVSGVEFALIKKSFGRRGKYRELDKTYYYSVMVGETEIVFYTKKGE